jgi:2-polyprenyl-3-methyl-5-hydroxy-6-metoxy-1,4-benzoquinol methylase
MAERPPTPILFFETINAFHRSAVLKSAIELDFFTAIARGHNTPETIAAACKIPARSARVLADYLTVIGFVTKAAEQYALTPDTATFLDRQSPAYVGGAVEFLWSPHMRERFDHLTESLRAGGAPENSGSLNPEHEMWVRFARGMAGLFAMPAEALARRILGTETNAPMRVLDVAAGHGLYGVAFARLNPNAEVVACDWRNVLEVARENAQKAGVQDRHSTIAGSAFDVDWGGDYDVILLTNFLHHFRPQEITRLLKKVHKSLKAGGRVVALEFIPNEDRITPPTSAAFAMTMLATTPGGDAYTFAEYEPMFREAGFGGVECYALEPTMQQVVVGRK